MTKICDNSEVIMHFTVKLEDGSVADSTKTSGKPAKLVMGDGSLTENFEKCLLGLSEGESASFTLEPDDAFGQPSPDNVQHMDRSLFAGDAPPKKALSSRLQVPVARKFRELLPRLLVSPLPWISITPLLVIVLSLTSKLSVLLKRLFHENHAR